VDLTAIRYRKLEAVHADRIDQALNTLASVADRLCFVRAPFDLGNVAAVADDFRASLIVCDYIQRISPPGDHQLSPKVSYIKRPNNCRLSHAT